MRATAKRSNKWKPSFDIVVLEMRCVRDTVGDTWWRHEVSRPGQVTIPMSDKLLTRGRAYAKSIGLAFDPEARPGKVELTDLELLALSLHTPAQKQKE
jgi:hypothetical protein